LNAYILSDAIEGESREVGKAADEMPTQFGMVNDVANPPKPPTAG
jgi:glycerate-2-kinase